MVKIEIDGRPATRKETVEILLREGYDLGMIAMLMSDNPDDVFIVDEKGNRKTSSGAPVKST